MSGPSPALFQLDRRTLRPIAVAGVPPDYFSADGQLWGNPLYDWPAHAAEGYAWWIARLRASFELCDVVRIDHFRGFEAYWAVPGAALTARTGRWMPGPGLEFFKAVKPRCPGPTHRRGSRDADAGTVALRVATGLPGMAVLQFAFGGGSDNLYLPHNHSANSVVYSGTHDNDTTRGWYATVDEKTRDHVRRYERIGGSDIGWDFIRAATNPCESGGDSPAGSARTRLGGTIQHPRKEQGNWSWRYHEEQLQDLRVKSGAYLRELAALYGREPVVKPAAKIRDARETVSSRASSRT